jgi:uncharacterized protein DUF302
MSTSPEPGVVSLASPHAFDDTTARVVRVLEHAGIKIFSRIDQQSAAEAVGLAMRPMMLVLFGNPKAATPLMQSHRTLAIAQGADMRRRAWPGVGQHEQPRVFAAAARHGKTALNPSTRAPGAGD